MFVYRATPMAILVLLGFSAALSASAPVEASCGECGETAITTNSIGMALRRVSAGCFRMGSQRGDPDERPVHDVTLSEPFCIGVYEVTQEQYEAVMEANPSNFKGPKRPVEQVTWEQAVEFCKRLSEKENAAYRLPTEAEWEYACRAGTETEFHWGDSFDTGYFWCGYNSARGSQEVGKNKPNAWGLHDMSGNVWEWCADRYDQGAYTAEERTDPRGPDEGSYRVVRGGSWYGTPEDCRAANRMRLSPDTRMHTVGFRVCREVSAK